jgi:large subunit ribosomal protein L12e
MRVRAVMLRVTGGEIASPAVLAPKLGPLGMAPKKVGEDIQAATKTWKGIKVMVKLTVQNRQAAIETIPSASAMVLKELHEPPRDRKKGPKNIVHNGNLTLDQVIDIARAMRPRSRARTLTGTVKEILGTCASIGVKVNGKHPKDVQKEIDDKDVEVPAA